jgi:hypothetical protein
LGAGAFCPEQLPELFEGATVIDGTTQPGSAAQPLVGSGGTVGVDALDLEQVRVPLVTLRQQAGDAAGS